jgi:hypothetical protein
MVQDPYTHSGKLLSTPGYEASANLSTVSQSPASASMQHTTCISMYQMIGQLLTCHHTDPIFPDNPITALPSVPMPVEAINLD